MLIMNRRVKIAVYAIAVAIIVLLFMQYFWIDRMFRTEQELIRTRASLLLTDVLDLDLKRSSMERYDVLVKAGVHQKERYGGAFEDKTITVYVAYPEPKKIVRQCDTEEEWYEYTKDIYCRYHITGIDLHRLDSAYKAALKRHEITLPFTLVKIDSANRIVEQVPNGIDLRRYGLSVDTIALGITDEEYLVARFDNSYFGMFRQMRSIVFTSLGVVVLLTVILIYLVHTIFYQKKIAKVREELVSSIVHDLKNPVTYIKNALLHVAVKDKQSEYIINKIKGHTERMFLMIEKMLAVSIGKEHINISDIPEPVCEYISKIIEQSYMDDDYYVRFSCESNVGMAKINRLHFGNAMRNLIDNSIKYSVGNAEVDIRCYEENNYVCISVKDKGIGIPKEYMRFLFQKNFRVPSHKSLSKHGFGLGLNYVMMVAKAHGGVVKVKSEYKKGSEFILMLPVAK